MLNFFKEQANTMSKTFNREYIKAHEGLQILQELSQRFHPAIDKGTDTQDILEITKQLSTLCKFLEMANNGIDSIIGSIDKKTFESLSNSSPVNLIESRVKDWIKFDFSTYQVDDKIKISIIHVVNATKKLCFVQDTAKYFNIELSNCILGTCKLPPIGEIFAINMNAKWLRAIRVDAEPTNTNIRIRLIDRGETLSINPNTTFVSLNSEAQKVPPNGFVCHIEKVNNETITSLDSISRMITYDANINAICANMLVLDLWSVNDEDNVKILNDSIVEYINGISKLNETSKLNGSSELNGTLEMNGTSKMHNGKKAKNPFVDDDDEVDSLVSEPSQNEPPTSEPPVCLLPPLPPRKNMPNERIKIPVRVIQNNVQTKCASVPDIDKTPETSTESNDNLINGNTEFCNIGNNCETGAHPKWLGTYGENQKRLKDHSHFEPQELNKFKLPSIGDMIDILPRHFSNFDEVFIHISPSDPNIFINELEDKLRPMKKIPRVNDYVLARYSMDHSIYRAKVIQIVDAESVVVYYIDYGNTELTSIDYIFEWEKMCDMIPAQAVYCQIANMRRICKVTPEKRFEYLANKYTDQPCKARILDKTNDCLTIILMTSIGIDICDEIIEYYQSIELPASIV